MHTLKNYEKAIIDPNKVSNYLLSESHPTGKHKAMFFRKFGYSLATYAAFQDEILRLACFGIIVKLEKRNVFGTSVTMRAT